MKTLTMYRPGAIQNALSDFDRYFESFLGDSIFSPATRVLSRLPAVDIRETENAYTLDMELPGYNENNIEIQVDGSSLSIASKQEESREENGSGTDQEKWILRERRLNSFSRSFKLPENANPEEVSASFKNGILGLEIKKREEAKKKTVIINAK